MDLQIFALLIGLLLFLPWYWFISTRFRDYFDKSASTVDQIKAGLLFLLGFFGIGYLTYLISPGIYQYFLKQNPLLLAQIITVFSWLFFVGLAIVVAISFLKLLVRLPERWQNADSPDLKLFQVVGVLAFGLLSAGTIYFAWTIGAAIYQGWDNRAMWNESIQKMREVQTFEQTKNDEHRIENAQILIARQKTCLSEEKGGGCDFSFAEGDMVVTYMTLDGIVTDKVISLRQRGDTVYVLSFAPDSMFKVGWVRQSNFRSTTDLFASVIVLVKSLISLPALISFGTDLLIGGLTTLIIVVLTRGALEQGILFLIFLFSMISLILRYTAGRLIPPGPLLMLAFLPFAIGSAVEEQIIKLLRRIGY